MKINKRVLGAGCLFIWAALMYTYVSPGVAADKLPEFYGIYIRQSGKIIALEQGALTFRTGLSIGGIKSGLYGIPAPPKIRIDEAPFEIIFFDQQLSPDKLRLSLLSPVHDVQANFFDIKKPKTDPRFFRNVYSVSYNKLVAINLWCVEQHIPLKIAPVAEKPGMYRFVPEQTLQAGLYAVNFGSVAGPTYYTGNLKFHPFALGSAKWLEEIKTSYQMPSSQPVSPAGKSSPPDFTGWFKDLLKKKPEKEE